MEKRIGLVRGSLVSVIALTAIFAGGVGMALAEESAVDTATVTTPSTTAGENRAERAKEKKESMEAKKAQVQEKRTEMKENREEKKATIQEGRQEKRSDRSQEHARRLGERFGFYADRLGRIIDKLEARLTTMKGEGKDVSSATAKLDSAKSALDKAEAEGANAVSAFASIDPAKYEEQRDKALSARDLAMQAREQFKAVNVILKEVVTLAKSAQ